MKIGTSLSRCVKDIYEDTVHIDEVLVVIARTDFDPEDDKQWTGIWEGYAGGNGLGSMYSQPEWSNIPAEDEQAVRDICISLKNEGKMHQPRQYGAHPPRMNHYWYDVMLTPENLETNLAAKKAWENYKLLAELTYK
jgi:hypothetical protein